MRRTFIFEVVVVRGFESLSVVFFPSIEREEALCSFLHTFVDKCFESAWLIDTKECFIYFSDFQIKPRNETITQSDSEMLQFLFCHQGLCMGLLT